MEFNGRKIVMFHDAQDDHQEHHCRNLDKESARCMIHENNPFHCDFELIRFVQYKEKTIITQKLFGRKWAMLRFDEEHRGTLCEMTTASKMTTSDTTRRLMRLKEWTDHFGLRTYLPRIIAWTSTGPHEYALRIGGEELVVI